MDFYTNASAKGLIGMQLQARQAFEQHLDFRVFAIDVFQTKIPELLRKFR